MQRHVYLSPHLDDAVLSCGGTIAKQAQRGDEVLIVNVFSKVPESELSPLAQSLHAQWGLGAAAMAERRREDGRALEVLGVKGEDWNLLEAVYRRSAAGGFRYDSFDSLFQEKHPEDRAIIDVLLHRLHVLCEERSRPFRLYGPLAIGGHVDHAIVHKAVCLLQHSLANVLFYEDQLYASASGGRLGERLLAHTTRWVPRIHVLSEHAELKKEALAKYKSQGTGKEWVQRRLMDYSQKLSSGHAYVERFWEPIPQFVDEPVRTKPWSSIICCPLCRGHLQQNPDAWTCRNCSRAFPVRLGIADLRVFDPAEAGYVSMKADLERAQLLYDAYEDLDYGRMTARLLTQSETSSDKLADHYLAYRSAAKSRARQVLEAIIGRQIPPKGKMGVGLDIGCGSGVGLLAMSAICPSLVGVDISLSELVCAKKLLDEHRRGGMALLVAACAEALPLVDKSCDVALARDVYEHVPDQKAFLREACRVLQVGGRFLFNTTSRYTWVEPHVLLRGVGFLPRFLQPFYVRLRRGREYAVHNPSLFELRRTLKRTLQECDWDIDVPERIRKDDHASTFKGKAARKVPGLAELMNSVFSHGGPFQVVVQRRF